MTKYIKIINIIFPKHNFGAVKIITLSQLSKALIESQNIESIYIFFFQNFSTPKYDEDCNPGGSNDISLYYSPDMVQDPWKNLKPVPVKKQTQ